MFIAGFGNACARRLDSLGFTVVAGCYDDSGEGAAELKKASSGNLYIIKLDITDEENVRQLMLRVKSLCGGKGKHNLIKITIASIYHEGKQKFFAKNLKSCTVFFVYKSHCCHYF